MAEAVFHSTAGPTHPLIGTVDSAGTGAYHIGSSPDQRTLAVLSKNGVTEYLHAARQVREADFYAFDYILGMDEDNVTNLKFVRSRIQHRKGNEGLAQVRLFGEYGSRLKKGRAEEVEDPYYGGQKGFDVCYEQMVRFSKALLETIENDGKGTKL
jgi:low molecular weight phosphotyrosine protein phosphatase